MQPFFISRPDACTDDRFFGSKLDPTSGFRTSHGKCRGVAAVKGAPTDFWGKLERDAAGEVTSWHPLIGHCADVAACATALLALPAWRRHLAYLCGWEDLDEVTRARLSVFAALHDLGKFNIGFQAKGRAELGATAGHVVEALSAIGQDVFSCCNSLGDWGEGATGLLASAICHHGRPYALTHATQFEPALWGARAGLNCKAGVEALLDRCRSWFPIAFDGPMGTLVEHPALEHGYAGVVMLADWIGSDTRIFPYSNGVEEDRMVFALDAAKRFVAESWLEIGPDRRTDSWGRNAFKRVTPFSPRAAQRAILTLPDSDPGSITILECETGSGKTEAALARFVSLFSAGAVDGLYFALPTRTAATQMYHRVHLAVQRAFKTPPPVVLAVPGYVKVDDTDAEKLPRFKVLWPDEGRFRYRGWAGEGPKRYLSGCVVVGTVDQILLSSLRVCHAHLRASALFRQLLVVDEVHASDAYMTRILEDVLARHVAAGGHALLLSATLGAEARVRLLAPGKTASIPTVADAITTPYPRISHRGSREIALDLTRDRFSRRISVSACPWLEDTDAVAAAAVTAATAGAKVIVIKNTVADCVHTQRAVERAAMSGGSPNVLFNCASVIAPHHARFARLDREALDRTLDEQFGRKRSEGGCVVVATQTVQQSLDLDADFLITDLCPMDVLLQRLGRLHRHRRARPHGFEAINASVVVPANRDLGILLGREGRARHHHGLGTVYCDLRVLEATWRLIENRSTWDIPAMNRELVELSLHPSALNEITAEKGAEWDLHGQRVIGSRYGEARQAHLNLVDWTQPYSEASFSDDVRIPTRLGDSDRRVEFDSPFLSPFGFRIAELTVRAAWTMDIPADEYMGRLEASSGDVTRFVFGEKSFIYDRLGLRKSFRDEEGGEDDGL